MCGGSGAPPDHSSSEHHPVPDTAPSERGSLQPVHGPCRRRPDGPQSTAGRRRPGGHRPEQHQPHSCDPARRQRHRRLALVLRADRLPGRIRPALINLDPGEPGYRDVRIGHQRKSHRERPDLAAESQRDPDRPERSRQQRGLSGLNPADAQRGLPHRSVQVWPARRS